MRSVAVILVLGIAFAIGAISARADDAATIEAINEAAAALDRVGYDQRHRIPSITDG